MSKKKNQKPKIMLIGDILKQARGEENAITTPDFCNMLNEHGISCDRRTLKSDIETLAGYVENNDLYDYTIKCINDGKFNKYYSVKKASSNTLDLSLEETVAVLTGLNTLSMTDNHPKTDIEHLKEKLIAHSNPDDRKKLSQYADDRFSLIDTVAAKVIIDAVNSLAFIDKKKSQELLSLIIRMADADSQNALEQEQKNPLYDMPSKSSISLYEFDMLFRAIDGHKKISFRYFNLDEKKKRVYRRDGNVYTVEPINMLPGDGHYYLLCYDADTTNKVRTYRIDRMCNVTETKEPICQEAIDTIERIPQLVRQTFHMFGGPVRTVTLEFLPRLMDNVYDAFGFETVVERTENDLCRVTEEIQVSPTFFAWLFQFGDSMKIVSPDDVMEDYRKMCELAIANHTGENNG